VGFFYERDVQMEKTWRTERQLQIAEWLSDGEDRMTAAGRVKDMLTSAGLTNDPYLMVDEVRNLFKSEKTWDAVKQFLREEIAELNRPQIVLNITNTNCNNTTTTTIINGPAVDEDPHRFSLGDYMDLRDKLEAHPRFAECMAIEGAYLKRNRKSAATASDVALVGCLWRRNIKAPKRTDDPGAVPFDAMTNFIKKDTSFRDTPMSELLIGSCLRILEGVGFLRQTRKVVKDQYGYPVRGKCAAYTLLNEDKW
jgi:hypothetical protein